MMVTAKAASPAGTNFGSGAKRRRTDSGTLPRSLRGTLCIFDDTLEQTEASDRFSTDDGRCALALLELQESRSRSRSLGRQVEVLETSRTAVPWKC